MDTVKVDLRSPGRDQKDKEQGAQGGDQDKESEAEEKVRRQIEQELEEEARRRAEEMDRAAWEKEQARRREEQARRERQAAEAEVMRRKAEEDAENEADRLAWEEEQEWLRKAARPPPWHRRVLRALFLNEPEEETPPRRFLFACELGDPISCVYIGPGGACMAGSVQGRIWLLTGRRGGPVGSIAAATAAASGGGGGGGKPKSLPPPPRPDVLAGFSEEGARGLYIDEDYGFATFGEACRGWRRDRPHVPMGNTCFRSLDRKNTQSVKHVLQRGPWICVLFPLSTTVVNVARREQHHHRAFKLFDFGSSTDIVPVDFDDGENLLLIDRTGLSGCPRYHLVHLESNEQKELEDLPEAPWISILKLWGPDCVVCVVGSAMHVYNYRSKQLQHTLRGHAAEILAVDARDPETIASLSSDGVVKLWSGTTGSCTRSVRVPGANYFLAYPYCLCMQDQRILISSDEGVYLVELEPISDVV